MCGKSRPDKMTRKPWDSPMQPWGPKCHGGTANVFLSPKHRNRGWDLDRSWSQIYGGTDRSDGISWHQVWRERPEKKRTPMKQPFSSLSKPRDQKGHSSQVRVSQVMIKTDIVSVSAGMSCLQNREMGESSFEGSQVLFFSHRPLLFEESFPNNI